MGFAHRTPTMAVKMHGDIDHPGSIVLSRGDFTRYGRSEGPSGAVLQSLMLSRHLLVVGASLTDDNFLRLAYEVDDFVKEKGKGSRRFGSVLTLRPEPVRARLFKGVFDYIDTSPDGVGNEKGRALAIFLDAVAMYASADSSFLLDPRYSFLLKDEEQTITKQVNALLEQISTLAGSEHDKWRSLAAALRGFGAR